METLPILAEMAENAHHFMGGIPVAVTPVSLKAYPAPLSYGDKPDRSGESLPSGADIRQASLFGAGWTLGTLKYLSQGGVASISYYETTGPLGIMEASKDTRAMKRASLSFGKVFPVYQVLADVGEYAGGTVLKTISSDPLAVEGLALMKGNLLTIILANLTAEEIPVALAWSKSQASICYLSRDNVELACANPEAYRAQVGELRRPDTGWIHLKLGPYSLAHIETIPSKSNRFT